MLNPPSGAGYRLLRTARQCLIDGVQRTARIGPDADNRPSIGRERSSPDPSRCGTSRTAQRQLGGESNMSVSPSSGGPNGKHHIRNRRSSAEWEGIGQREVPKFDGWLSWSKPLDAAVVTRGQIQSLDQTAQLRSGPGARRRLQWTSGRAAWLSSRQPPRRFDRDSPAGRVSCPRIAEPPGSVVSASTSSGISKTSRPAGVRCWNEARHSRRCSRTILCTVRRARNCRTRRLASAAWS